MVPKQKPWEAVWDMEEPLGKGGQGLTFLTRRKVEPAERAAMKVLRNKRDEQARGRMHREVASLQVLSAHGGAAVPRILDHNTQCFQDLAVELFVVMEYIPGQTLREVIDEDGSLPLQSATDITLRLCDTVEAAHTYPILHRDLKPENIIARDVSSADVVIVDYGLSFNAADPDITVTGETFRNRFLDLPETNTPGGNRRDPRSDVTAVCAIYYYLLTGHIPGQLQSGDGLLPHQRPGYSVRGMLGESDQIGQLEVLFGCGFATNLDSRFQSVGELRDRITLLTSAGSSTDLEDPVVVAQRFSAMLRQRDRKTQIGEFRKPAADALESLQQFAEGFRGKLERFSLGMTTREQKLGSTFPPELDQVLPTRLKLQLGLSNHHHLQIAIYTVASRGEQSVILRQTYHRKGGQGQTETTSEYEPLLWFDATSSPDLSPVQLDIQSWITTAMRQLTDEILGQ
jgi:serine/threonine protein kinase